MHCMTSRVSWRGSAARSCTFGSSAEVHVRQLQRSRTVADAIRARWQVNVRFGTRNDAVTLLQEWVRDVASEADSVPLAATISAGAIGTPECALELELEFPALCDLDRFWNTLPADAHRAWSQRLQTVVADGSQGPSWSVLHAVAVPMAAGATLPLRGAAGAAPATAALADRTGSGPVSGVRINLEAAKRRYDPLPRVTVPSTVSTSASGLNLVTSAEDAEAILAADGLVDIRKLPAGSSSVAAGAGAAAFGPADDAAAASAFMARLAAATSSLPQQVPDKATEGGPGGTLEGIEDRMARTQPRPAPRGPVRIGGGFKIPAGGAPAGSRLAAMVGDSEYYEQLAEKEAAAAAGSSGRVGNGSAGDGFSGSRSKLPPKFL